MVPTNEKNKKLHSQIETIASLTMQIEDQHKNLKSALMIEIMRLKKLLEELAKLPPSKNIAERKQQNIAGLQVQNIKNEIAQKDQAIHQKDQLLDAQQKMMEKLEKIIIAMPKAKNEFTTNKSSNEVQTEQNEALLLRAEQKIDDLKKQLDEQQNLLNQFDKLTKDASISTKGLELIAEKVLEKQEADLFDKGKIAITQTMIINTRMKTINTIRNRNKVAALKPKYSSTLSSMPEETEDKKNQPIEQKEVNSERRRASMIKNHTSQKTEQKIIPTPPSFSRKR